MRYRRRLIILSSMLAVLMLPGLFAAVAPPLPDANAQDGGGVDAERAYRIVVMREEIQYMEDLRQRLVTAGARPSDLRARDIVIDVLTRELRRLETRAPLPAAPPDDAEDPDNESSVPDSREDEPGTTSATPDVAPVLGFLHRELGVIVGLIEETLEAEDWSQLGPAINSLSILGDRISDKGYEIPDRFSDYVAAIVSNSREAAARLHRAKRNENWDGVREAAEAVRQLRDHVGRVNRNGRR